jgi:putative mycofactocin binding protein MftB
MESFLEQAWSLSPSVALRPEPFGALAYHFGNRKLTFLKQPKLVEVVKSLNASADVRAALDAAEVPEPQRAAYVAALEGLAVADMICRRESPEERQERA